MRKSRRTTEHGERRALWLAVAFAVLLFCLGFSIEHFGGRGGLPDWSRLYRSLGLELTAPDAPPAGDTAVVALDVGQGDATLLCQNGEFCLVDTGLYETGGDLVQMLTQLGVDRLSLLILTHPHGDHIGGAADVLRNFKVDRLVVTSLTPVEKASSWQRTILNLAGQDGVKTTAAEAGQEYPLGNGTVRILQDNYVDPACEALDEAINNTSICLKFTADGFSFLITGDAEKAAEQALVERYGGELDAVLLKAGHHGSYSSSSWELLQAVSPEAVVISCGANNEYGHPHRSALRRLSANGAEIWRTDQHGSVTFWWDGERLQASCTRETEVPAA